jgi:hypothetical protein
MEVTSSREDSGMLRHLNIFLIVIIPFPITSIAFSKNWFFHFFLPFFIRVLNWVYLGCLVCGCYYRLDILLVRWWLVWHTISLITKHVWNHGYLLPLGSSFKQIDGVFYSITRGTTLPFAVKPRLQKTH